MSPFTPILCTALLVSAATGWAEVTSDTLVVTGTRVEGALKDSPVATEVITANQIEAAGATDLAEALEESSGVQVDRTFGGARVSLRGLESKHVLILVDGQRMGGRKDGALDITRIAANHIERVEIVKGAASSLYGADALGGVINIITRRGAQPAMGATVQGDSRQQYTANVWGSVGDKRLSGRLGVNSSHRRAYDLDPARPDTDGSERARLSVIPRADARLGDLRLRLQGEYLHQRTDGIDAAAGGALLDRVNVLDTYTATASAKGHFDGTRLTLTLHLSQIKDQFEYDQRGSAALDALEVSRERLAVATAQVDQPLAGAHLATIGTELLVERLESPRLTAGDGRGARTRLSAYVQDVWTLNHSPYLTLVLGGRFDRDDQFGSQLSPKAALRYDPIESLALRATFGAGFRAPDFREQLLRFENPSVGYVVTGNPALKAETSFTADTSATLDLGAFWCATTLFWTEIDQLIQAELVATRNMQGVDQYQYINVAQARIRGVESQARVQLNHHLKLDAGYTLTDAQDLTERRRLAGRSKHRITGAATLHPHRTVDLTTRVAVNSSRVQYIGGANGDAPVSVDGFTTLDARAAWRLRPRLTLFVGLNNILDAGTPVEVPLEPRTAYAGVSGTYL